MLTIKADLQLYPRVVNILSKLLFVEYCQCTGILCTSKSRKPSLQCLCVSSLEASTKMRQSSTLCQNLLKEQERLP